MAKHVYLAVFTPEDNGQYSVRFPDLPDCFTGGDTLTDALEMAVDAAGLVLCDMEDRGVPAPAPSDLEAIQQTLAPGEMVSLVGADTVSYRKKYNNKAIKKTLTIPSWLNDMAEREDINFSATLQSALKEALHIG